jgi:hypothetical protein
MFIWFYSRDSVGPRWPEYFSHEEEGGSSKNIMNLKKGKFYEDYI